MTRARTAAALIGLLVGVLAALLVGMAGWATWLGDRLHADFWPVDNSRVATNILAGFIQAAIALGVAAVIYPPVRRWLAAEVDHVHAKLDHLADLTHHIVAHSDNIPNDDPLGRLWTDRRPERGRPTR